MNCEALLRRLDDHLDRETDTQTNQYIRAHLETCIFCSTLARVESDVLGRLRAALAAPPMPAGLAVRIHAALAREPDS